MSSRQCRSFTFEIFPGANAPLITEKRSVFSRLSVGQMSEANAPLIDSLITYMITFLITLLITTPEKPSVFKAFRI